MRYYRLKMLSESEEKQSMPQIIAAGLPEQLVWYLQQRLGEVSLHFCQSNAEILEELDAGNWSLLLLDRSVINITVATALSQAYPKLKQGKQSIIYCLEKNIDINLPKHLVGQIIFYPLDWEELATVVAETLGLSLPPPLETEDAITPSPDSLKSGVNAIWEKFKDKIFSRIEIIDQACNDILAGSLSNEVRSHAIQESHNLAESLGTVGSTIAREIEQLLQQKVTWEKEQAQHLCSLVTTLRQELEGKLVTNTVDARSANLQNDNTLFVNEECDRFTLPQLNPPLSEPPSLRILLAEDNTINQQICLYLLEKIGYRADVAVNGLEVLEALRRQTYDVVLMDVQMPLMDGLTATKQICYEWSNTSRPRIIALTANIMQGDKEECLQAGMDGYISKPIEIKALAEALSQCQPTGIPNSELPTQDLKLITPNSKLKTQNSLAKRHVGDSLPSGIVLLKTQNSLSSHPIDTKILQSFCKTVGEKNFARVTELINCYIEETGVLIKAMKNALLPLDETQLQQAAHTLKASSATLGATNLANLCQHLEAMSRTGTRAGASEKVLQIVIESEKVNAALLTQYQQTAGLNLTSTSENSPLILIVDDDNFVRFQLSGMLEDEGYRVVKATNGEEGLVACTDYSPDIVLLDAIMPAMDGFTCCQLLRKLPGGSSIPILMVTSLEDTESVDLAFEAGATDYITKPIHWAVLRQRVLRMIQASRAEVEIRKALGKEKELNDLKSRFVSMTSHEFRAPLNTILSSAELLEHFGHRFTDEKKYTHLNRIQLSVKKLTHLLNEILLIGKAEAGKLEFNPQPLELISFCKELLLDMQLSAGNNYILKFVSMGDCANACMDEEMLASILTNLLSNAIKYSPEGGKINLYLSCENSLAVFRIEDSGIGIPIEDQENLFNHFYRAKNVGNISGTGLGLSIVKNCVEVHGGNISVESSVGMGTTFIVTIPLKN